MKLPDRHLNNFHKHLDCAFSMQFIWSEFTFYYNCVNYRSSWYKFSITTENINGHHVTNGSDDRCRPKYFQWMSYQLLSWRSIFCCQFNVPIRLSIFNDTHQQLLLLKLLNDDDFNEMTGKDFFPVGGCSIFNFLPFIVVQRTFDQWFMCLDFFASLFEAVETYLFMYLISAL